MVIMNKLLVRIYKYLQGVNYKKYLEKYYNTTMCPNCNKWSHEKFLDGQEDRIKPKKWGYVLRCGNCNKKSRWNTVAAPVAIPCGKKGIIEK